MQLLANKALTTGELEAICLWLNNKDLMRYSEQRFLKHTIATQTKYISDLIIRNQHYYYSIQVNDVLIGTLTAVTDRNNGVAELGILIGHDKYRDKGYGLRAWEEAIDAMFGMGFRKVEAGCMAANDAMMRLCEKSGMLIEGCRNKRFVIGDGKTFSNAVLWGKFR